MESQSRRKNPWNPNLPNDNSSASFDTAAHLAQNSADRRDAWANLIDPTRGGNVIDANMSHLNPLSFEALQPYELDVAPAIKQQDFHHGVMITNFDSVDWAFTVGTPEFGEGKTMFVTPNPLYVHGDVNTQTHSMLFEDAVEQKHTPTALVGDVITMLSNNWNINDFRQVSLVADVNGVSEGGSLANPYLGRVSQASSTSYITSIITHNIPTNKQSVSLGESASFINNLLFIEDWTGSDMTLKGSLVVMDSRRYNRAFQLESTKSYGPSPFGMLAPRESDEALNWNGSLPPVYSPPNRIFEFNDDLMTAAGTPPFTPHGVSVRGAGGSIEVIK